MKLKTELFLIILSTIFFHYFQPGKSLAASVVKQWSIGGKIAFLGAMRDECLKDENECPQGFTVAMWLKTIPMHQTKQHHNNNDRTIVAYLLSNGGQSPRSNGFYVRRTSGRDEYEVGVAHRDKLWRRFIYLKPEKIAHFVFAWKADQGLVIYVDGLLTAHEIEAHQREYKNNVNETVGDPHPYFVANGDSLLFRQIFDEKTFLPAYDFSEKGHVLNVTYYHEFKTELEIGEMTLDFDDRLVAGCFYEIPFGAELVSSLSNYSQAEDVNAVTSKEQEILVIYFKCRNDCILKKDQQKTPWKQWLAIVDPRTFNCFCMLADAFFDSRHSILDASTCHNTYKQTKAQYTSVVLEKPPIMTSAKMFFKNGEDEIQNNYDLLPSAEPVVKQFSVLVPSMKCFFVISGQFGSYDEAIAACRRRGARLASLKNDLDDVYVQSQLNWQPLTKNDGEMLPEQATAMLPQQLLWVESRNSSENTCNFCADVDENCVFLSHNQKKSKKCDCQCATVRNGTSTTGISNAVGVLCEKTVFDMPAETAVGKAFCGVPAVSPDSPNAFSNVGETLKSFSVLSGKLNWDEAVEACGKLSPGSTLASIRSPEENIAIQHELQEVWSMTNDSQVIEPLWIGARRPGPHRPSFIWTDGSPVLFTAWVIGEPNNAIEKTFPEGLDGEECVGIWPIWSSGNMAKSWNDFNCHENRTTKFGAICESF